ncbi:MAG: hypothetical protein M1457_10930, partial [bacterium]|nr:hypothetical protein [bacterium]
DHFYSRTMPDGTTRRDVAYEPNNRWPTRLTVTVDRHLKPMKGPVDPVGIKAHKETITYVYDLPAARNTRTNSWLFADEALFVKVTRPGLNVALVVPRDYCDVAADVLELAEPVVKDFVAARHVRLDSPVVPIAIGDNYLPGFKEIRKFRNIYRYRGRLENRQRDPLTNQLNSLESNLLTSVYWTGLYGSANPQGHTWDLNAFLSRNLTCGLNHRLSMMREFQPLAFKAAAGALDSRSIFQYTGAMSRAELLDQSRIPIFQMLYWTLGHETWQAMEDALKPRLREDALTTATLRAALADALAAKPAKDFPTIAALDPLLDYWLGSGKDLPCYRIDAAAARLLPDEAEGAAGAAGTTGASTGNEEETRARYEVVVTVRNEGTG